MSDELDVKAPDPVFEVAEVGVSTTVSAEYAAGGDLDALRGRMREALESAAQARGCTLGQDTVTVDREPGGGYAVRMTALALKQVGLLLWDPA